MPTFSSLRVVLFSYLAITLKVHKTQTKHQ